MLKEKIIEAVLDGISDDYYNFWEAYSDFKKSIIDLSELQKKREFLNLLKKLYELKLIAFYKGTTFTGEEKEIPLELTDFLCDKLINDWRYDDEYEIRLSTTEKADNFLKLKYELKSY